MLALILALSVSLQPALAAERSASGERDNIQAALTDAQVAVDRIGHCTEELPARTDLETEYQTLLGRLVAAEGAARARYPNVDPNTEAVVRLMAGGTPRCSPGALRRYAAAARRSLALAEQSLRTDRGPYASGLWLGSLKLCGDRVVAVEPSDPEHSGGTPGVVLHFSSGFGAQVRALTTRNVGRQLSVVLDGVVIMSPRVMEPTGEAVNIVGPDGVPVDRIRAAATAPC